MFDITFVRFLHVIKHICYTKGDSSMRVAFSYYDYDKNGSIGSVDIMNLTKHLCFDKIQKIHDKYMKI
jgi:Ca2+-binding EF-hand superfamily protein